MWKIQSVRRVGKKRYEGRYMRLQEKQKSTTQTTTKSVPPKKYASRSEQGRKRILQSPSRGRTQKSVDANSGTPGKGRGKKEARSKSASKSTKQTSKTDGAKSRGWSKKR